ELEELEGLDLFLVREQDGRADLFVALMDLVEVHPQYTMSVPCPTLSSLPRPPHARSVTPSAATRDRRSRSRWRSTRSGSRVRPIAFSSATTSRRRSRGSARARRRARWTSAAPDPR